MSYRGFEGRVHGDDDLVPGAELVLEEGGGAEALELASAHDPNPVAQHVRLEREAEKETKRQGERK